MINEDIIDTMVVMAKSAINKSYSPYSGKKSGACALTSDGTLYPGSDVENASSGLSCCAAIVAVFNAVADSKREFDAIAVVSDSDETFAPGGECCQIFAEFGIREIIIANSKGDVTVTSLEELAPCTLGIVGGKRI